MFNLPRSTVITIASFALVLGILCGHFLTSFGYLWLIFPVLIFAIGLRHRNFKPAVIILFLALGLIRGEDSRTHYQELSSRYEEKVLLIGTIKDDPAANERHHYEFTLGNLILDGNEVKGEIKTTTYVSKLKRGYRVQAYGKLKPTLGSKQGRMFADIEVLDARQTLLEKLRQGFLAGVNNAMPDPLAGFVLGILIGARSLLPETVEQQLRIVGLTHLIAVSGYNLTILARAAYRHLKNISGFLAISITLWLIFGFMLISGFSASVVRAAVMALLMLWAAYYGRSFKPLAIIGLTAAMTAMYKPSYIWSDLSWQLSFLAFFGIIVLAPLMIARLKLRDTWFTGLLMESTAAHIMTFPLIMVIFGTFSALSPLANLFVLPAIPMLMFFGFIAGICGMLLPALSVWVGLPAVLLAGYILHLTAALSNLPGYSTALHAPAPLAILFYVSFMLLILALMKRTNLPEVRREATPLA